MKLNTLACLLALLLCGWTQAPNSTRAVSRVGGGGNSVAYDRVVGTADSATIPSSCNDLKAMLIENVLGSASAGTASLRAWDCPTTVSTQAVIVFDGDVDVGTPAGTIAALTSSGTFDPQTLGFAAGDLVWLKGFDANNEGLAAVISATSTTLTVNFLEDTPGAEANSGGGQRIVRIAVDTRECSQVCIPGGGCELDGDEDADTAFFSGIETDLLAVAVNCPDAWTCDVQVRCAD